MMPKSDNEDVETGLRNLIEALKVAKGLEARNKAEEEVRAKAEKEEQEKKEIGEKEVKESGKSDKAVEENGVINGGVADKEVKQNGFAVWTLKKPAGTGKMQLYVDFFCLVFCV
ncbi:hypothetical protein NL676_014930 [Syzygium grande]|nr:hypothetical protein NL676_014930 [Syzygium grande]